MRRIGIIAAMPGVLKPLVQAQLSKIEGVNAFAFNLPPLPGGPGGLPVQMVINSTNGFQAIYEQMVKLKDAARKSGLFIVSDSDLDFNQPVVRVKIDRSKANDLGITMQSIGNTLSTQICEAVDVNPSTRVRDLTDEEVARLRTYIDANFRVEGDLRRDVSQDIKRKMEINCYQGVRHRKGLPVHGQRTHTNARTRKGPKKTVAGKKKVKK